MEFEPFASHNKTNLLSGIAVIIGYDKQIQRFAKLNFQEAVLIVSRYGASHVQEKKCILRLAIATKDFMYEQKGPTALKFGNNIIARNII